MLSLFSVLQFFACLVIIFGAEVAAGVFGFLNKEQVQNLFLSFSNTIIGVTNMIIRNLFTFILFSL